MRNRYLLALFVSAYALVCSGPTTSCQEATAKALQARLDQHCAAVGKRSVDPSEKPVRLEAFYSWRANTCVQIEVVDGASWGYVLRDVSHGLFQGLAWTKASTDKLFIYNTADFVSVDGYWQSTDPEPSHELVGQMAAKIQCTRDESICKESDAAVQLGVLTPSSSTYTISSWTRDGIVADDNDEGNCAIGHRLSIDFRSNSALVTDYPKKIGGGQLCEAFQSANSYSLHGGSLVLYETNVIFDCSSSGANSAILAKVDEYHGMVADKGYGLWMDDGDGGQPATLKTPKRPYSRNDCERLMEKKLRELRSQ